VVEAAAREDISRKPIEFYRKNYRQNSNFIALQEFSILLLRLSLISRFTGKSTGNINKIISSSKANFSFRFPF